MRTVTATELRMRLGEILDAASAGERILIERDHKPLAYLVSVEEVEATMETDRKAKIERQLAALDRLVEFGKEMREKYPEPDDGLTYVEWRRQEYERRDEKISRAAAGLPPADDESVRRP
jgi:prevent-host-death family protein